MIEFAPAFKSVVPLLNLDPQIGSAIRIAVFLLLVVAIIDMSARQLKGYAHVLFSSFLLFATITLYLMTEVTHLLSSTMGISYGGGVNVLEHLTNLSSLAEIMTLYMILYLFFGSLMAFINFASDVDFLSKIVANPLLEEILYRYLLLGFFTSMGLNVPEAIGVSALLFALAPNRLIFGFGGDWHGFYKPITAFIMGIFLGFAAVSFGFLFALGVHMLWAAMDRMTLGSADASA